MVCEQWGSSVFHVVFLHVFHRVGYTEANHMNTRKITILSLLLSFWCIVSNLVPLLELGFPLTSILLALLIPFQITWTDTIAFKIVTISISFLLRPDVALLPFSMWKAMLPTSLLQISLPSNNVLLIMSVMQSFSTLLIYHCLQIRVLNKVLRKYVVFT